MQIFLDTANTAETREAASRGTPSAASVASVRMIHAARADMCRRLGRKEEARAAYLRALELTQTEPERRFLQRRLAE